MFIFCLKTCSVQNALTYPPSLPLSLQDTPYTFEDVFILGTPDVDSQVVVTVTVQHGTLTVPDATRDVWYMAPPPPAISCNSSAPGASADDTPSGNASNATLPAGIANSSNATQSADFACNITQPKPEWVRRTEHRIQIVRRAGSLQLNGSIVDIDAHLNGSLVYTPHPDYAGPDVLLVSVQAAAGASNATVGLLVQAVNDPPVIEALSEYFEIQEHEVYRSPVPRPPHLWREGYPAGAAGGGGGQPGVGCGTTGPPDGAGALHPRWTCHTFTLHDIFEGNPSFSGGWRTGQGVSMSHGPHRASWVTHGLLRSLSSLQNKRVPPAARFPGSFLYFCTSCTSALFCWHACCGLVVRARACVRVGRRK